ALVPAGRTPEFYKTINAQTQWQEISAVTLTTNTITASVNGFSLAEPAIPPLVAGRPGHQWEADLLVGDGLRVEVVDEDIQDEAPWARFCDFGGILPFPGGPSTPTDGIASGEVTASADGRSWSVSTEAPLG